MSTKLKIAIPIVLALGAVLAATIFLQHYNVAVLSPQGTIAAQQRSLIAFTVLLSLLVVVPVFTLTIAICWRYRASAPKAQYKPDWDHNRKLEFLWWMIPTLIIVVLAGVAWKSSHDLDPFKPLISDKAPITVQVVALQWKWLFIYPEQQIATVNYVQFPEKTPINFVITADAPMNSFWIPQLGGQVYAMSGMQTQLHLMANGTGSYKGSSANLSGEGFAKMKFVAKSTSLDDFNSWVAKTQKSPKHLTSDTYKTLAKPSTSSAVSYYSANQSDLYDTVIMKYMGPQTTGHDHEDK